MAYFVLVPEKLRARIDDAGRVELVDSELAFLKRKKYIYFVLLILVQFVVLFVMWLDYLTWVGFSVVPAWFVFGIGGTAEVLLTPDLDNKQRLEGVAVQVAAQIAGAIAFHRLMEIVSFDH